MVLAIVIAMPPNSFGVGYYRVGVDQPACSPLVARGVVPDALNLLSEAFPMRHVANALDRIAMDVRALTIQVGQQPEAEIAMATTSKRDLPPEIEEPAKVEKKPVPLPKVSKDKKQTKVTAKPTAKKKPVKAPPKAQ
jgi:hypothetical protein